MKTPFTFICILSLISLSGCTFSQNPVFPENTYVANESIVKSSEEQVKSRLNERIEQWKNDTFIVLKVDDDEIWSVPLDLFSFQIDETMKQIQQQTDNPVILNIQMDQIKEKIKEKTNNTYTSYVNFEQLEEDLTSIAAFLKTGTHSFQLNRYLIQKQSEIVSSSSIRIPDSFKDFVHDWVSMQQEIEIPGNSIFSLNTYMNQSKQNITDDKWSFLATSIYQTILKSNFEILKRTKSRSLPSYTTIGYDVKVSPNRLDFVFQNINPASYKLIFSIREDLLYVELFGSPFLYEYDIEVENLKYYQDEPIIYYSDEMEQGTSYIRKNGAAAVSASIYRLSLGHDGSLIEKELISKEFYPSIPGEEVLGIAEPVETVDTEPVVENEETINQAHEITKEYFKQIINEIIDDKLEETETTPANEVDK